MEAKGLFGLEQGLVQVWRVTAYGQTGLAHKAT